MNILFGHFTMLEMPRWKDHNIHAENPCISCISCNFATPLNQSYMANAIIYMIYVKGKKTTTFSH